MSIGSRRAPYLAVGSFVLAMALAGAFLLARLSGGVGARDHYATHFDSVLGVVEGTPVLFEGFPIGRVTGMTRAPGQEKRFRVELAVREGFPVPRDSVAMIIQPTLLAPMAIDIRAGTSEELLEPGASIDGRDGTNLMGAVANLTGDVDAILREAVAPLLGDVAGSAPAILQNLERFSGSLDAAGQELRTVASRDNAERIARMVSNFERASEHLVTLSSDLSKSRAELDRALAGMNALLEGRDRDAERIVADLKHVLGSVASHIDAVNANLEGASQNLYEFSREVRRNPGVLLGGSGGGEEDALTTTLEARR